MDIMSLKGKKIDLDKNQIIKGSTEDISYEIKPNKSTVYSIFRPIIRESITNSASFGPAFDGVLSINEVVSVQQADDVNNIKQKMVLIAN